MTNDMKSKSHIKHGFRKRKTDNRMYSIWVKMKQRCYNENDKAYKDYGGRGITVCEEWLHDFQAFYDWSMKNGYRDDLSIDRKDVNGNYCPENCRWATIKEQVNNTRRNIILEYNGKKQTLSQLSEEVCMDYMTLYRRIKSGWSVERALTTPIKNIGRKSTNNKESEG